MAVTCLKYKILELRNVRFTIKNHVNVCAAAHNQKHILLMHTNKMHTNLAEENWGALQKQQLERLQQQLQQQQQQHPERLEAPPHIGIMCMDLAQALEPICSGLGKNWQSYLPSSYIKHLEASGALVIPIWIGRERAYYEGIMSLVNGVLLPGGAVYLDDEPRDDDKEYAATATLNLTNDCVKSLGHIYSVALEQNRKGKYFPIWGTCLGFQLMLKEAQKAQDPTKVLKRSNCEKFFGSYTLCLTDDYRKSRMFGNISADLADSMTKIPFACHQHKYCITEEGMGDLLNDWHVLATRNSKTQESGSSDSMFKFITIIEHRTYPYFGCQFHPERTAYEQLIIRHDACREAHSSQGIQLAQYFADFFVNACRKNTNRFGSNEELSRHLIYNWKPIYSGVHNDANWLQVYLFAKDEDYPEVSHSFAVPAESVKLVG